MPNIRPEMFDGLDDEAGRNNSSNEVFDSGGGDGVSLTGRGLYLINTVLLVLCVVVTAAAVVRSSIFVVV